MLDNTEDFIFQDQGGANTLVSVKEDGDAYRASLIIGVAASGDKREEGSLMLKIVSGGQTGVDRAALDVAIERGIAYGGWCPKGCWAEDMPNPPGLLSRYPDLRETPEADPSQRTEWNVRDTDRLMVWSTAQAWQCRREQVSPSTRRRDSASPISSSTWTPTAPEFWPWAL